MSKDTGGPAFPYSALQPGGPTLYADSHGMTLRDYFAAKALTALMQTFLMKDLDTVDPHGWTKGLSSEAYQIADDMLEARQQ